MTLQNATTGPDFVSFQVRDLPASADFYERLVGLARIPAPNPDAAVFSSGTTSFAVRRPMPGVDLDAHAQLGAGVGAATTVQFGEDVYAFTRNMGLFGGLAVDGNYAAPRDDWNHAFYGQPLTTEQIVIKRMAPEVLGTQALRESLSQF